MRTVEVTAPRWPGGAAFAFSIFDDTDRITVASGEPVYDLITQLGLRVTKSVWPVRPDGPARTGGATCDDPAYLAWVLRLQAAGHEIGFHNASDHPSQRATTVRALDRFEELFGAPPRIGSDHVGNHEAMYWGARRLSGVRSTAYRLAMAASRPYRAPTSGEDPTSDYFWGDVLRDRIDYWRNFTFANADTLACCPQMPYHDPARPYVNWWFASSHAPTANHLLALLTPDRLDALEADGGACILYTHFGMGFSANGEVDPRVVEAFTHLAGRRVWFAPASEILDHLRAQRGNDRPLSDRDRRSLENRWILEQLRLRTRSEAERVLRGVRHRPEPWTTSTDHAPHAIDADDVPAHDGERVQGTR